MQLKQHPLNPPASDPIHREKTSILGLSLDNLSPKNLHTRIRNLIKDHQFHTLITANALFILDWQKQKILQQATSEAALVIPESSGTSWAAHFLNKERVHRYSGIDLAFNICGLAEQHKWSIFMLGGQPGIAEKAAHYLKGKFPSLSLAGVHDGYFDPSESNHVADKIQQANPNIILVALGMPKQELWIYQNQHHLPPGLYMGVGGTFDVWAGQIKRAPKWIQRLGCEWLYRGIRQPARWKRISTLPKFAFNVFVERYWP